MTVTRALFCMRQMSQEPPGLGSNCFCREHSHHFFDCVGHSRSRARASYPRCATAYPRGSRSRVFQFMLNRAKNLDDFLNCVPVTDCTGDAEDLLDLAKVTDCFHLPAVNAENESTSNSNDF